MCIRDRSNTRQAKTTRPPPAHEPGVEPPPTKKQVKPQPSESPVMSAKKDQTGIDVMLKHMRRERDGEVDDLVKKLKDFTVKDEVWRDLGFAFGKFDGQISVVSVSDVGDTKEAEILFTLSKDNRLLVGVKSDNEDPEYIKIYMAKQREALESMLKNPKPKLYVLVNEWQFTSESAQERKRVGRAHAINLLEPLFICTRVCGSENVKQIESRTSMV
eukprot:TRINITY_DN5617_c0_g1_i9.p1 TRINITY_DN5617_c0_g1~~TRINITY_DN5617_c0_g1_i9.p1  ORF type:complete len:240 (+),score=67.96 TRINITY_DN5617_c0_g1_i9:73-720(+)